jgi:hypothetical protein
VSSLGRRCAKSAYLDGMKMLRMRYGINPIAETIKMMRTIHGSISK